MATFIVDQTIEGKYVKVIIKDKRDNILAKYNCNFNI